LCKECGYSGAARASGEKVGDKIRSVSAIIHWIEWISLLIFVIIGIAIAVGEESELSSIGVPLAIFSAWAVLPSILSYYLINGFAQMVDNSNKVAEQNELIIKARRKSNAPPTEPRFAAQQVEPTEERERFVCWKCGRQLRGSNEFCGECGEPQPTRL
jgi:predicted RND superfamily exporter protein